MGAFVSGILSDILYGQRALTALLFCLLSIPVMIHFPSTQLREIALFETAQASGAAAGPLVLTPYWGEAYPDAVDALMVHQIARVCIFLAGFAMNGPKTVIGICIRSSIQNPKLIGTVGGILGLVGQCGAYTGSRLLSHLLAGGTSRVFSIEDMLSENSLNFLLGLPAGSTADVNGWAQSWLRKAILGKYTAWELFPVMYTLFGVYTTIMLIVPTICEGYRLFRVNSQQNLRKTK
jgi:cation transporter-like permease